MGRKRVVWDFMDTPPKAACLTASFLFDGGSAMGEQADRIRIATLAAFVRACAKEGLLNAWECGMTTCSPKQFDARLARKNMGVAREQVAKAGESKVDDSRTVSRRESAVRTTSEDHQ